ncbi:hypothetical protein [Egicoccus sp. AB-alg6-2]|uniref:hypothetical protein n=1 Tax=Egicoccus sp. AB-alg6-2 TaxID=3242692 RepID=UPI00359D82C0
MRMRPLSVSRAQERDGLSSIRGRIAVMAALAMTVPACAGEAEIPELTARPVPAPAELDLVPALPDWRGSQPAPPDAASTPAPAGEPSLDPAEEPGSVTPSYDAQRAAFLYAHVEDVEEADHLAYDLVGDGVPELVVVARAGAAGLDVTLAAWNGEDYAAVGNVTVPAAPERLGTPVARDLTGDGRHEVVAPFVDEAGAAAVTLRVAEDGALLVFDACPIDAPQQHRLRLKASRDATEVTFTCDGARDGARAEAAATVLRWRDGLFVAMPEDADAPAVSEAPDQRPGPPGHTPPGQSDDRGREIAPGQRPMDDDGDEPGRRRGHGPADERGRGEASDRD